jgi:hypothetical protein
MSTGSRDSERDSITLDGIEVHVVEPSYDTVGIELQSAPVVLHAHTATRFSHDDILDV